MKGKLFQVQVAFLSSFGQFVMALLNVWPSYTSSIYASNSTTPLSEPMTETQNSLLSSLPSLGAMLGTAVVGILIDKLGRKRGGIILALPYAVSWAMIGATRSVEVVLAARFLGGAAGGGFLVYAPIFISEVAEDSVRGMLASGPILLYVFGMLLSYLFGCFLSYRVIVWTNLLFGVALAALLVTITESPVFLLRQNREEEAKAAIAHYRGCSPSSKVVLDEFSRLKQQIYPAVELISITGDEKVEDPEKMKLNSEVAPEERARMSPMRMLLTSPASRRAFLVVSFCISMQVLMGMVPVQVYARSVFEHADPAKADLYTVLFAVVLLAGSVLTAVIIDKAGRRILIISSSSLVCLSLVILGYLLQSHAAPAWATVLMVFVYCFSFMFGAGSIPYVLLTEVFISEVQSLASVMIIEWVWFLNFVILAVFPMMKGAIGMHGTFYVFAGCSLVNAVVNYFIVPETKGLSNEQIQEVLLGRKREKIAM